MTDADAVGQGVEDRAQITRRIRSALWAIEHGDEAGWRTQVDALIAWRNQPLLQGLVRLARELAQTLGDAPSHGGALPDACAHLESIVRMSEDASHRALDRLEQCGELLSQMHVGAGVQAHAEATGALRAHFSELTAAQGIQDLTGQVIRRVVEILRCVHAGMDASATASAPLQLNGSLAAVNPSPATQDEANELLSSLGI
ncbi:MAG: protein phosphatase CheZ [Luteimonas sp.]